MDSRFKILSKARDIYHLSVIELLFIRTRELKICKQWDVYNIKLYKQCVVLLMCVFVNFLLSNSVLKCFYFSILYFLGQLQTGIKVYRG